MWHQFRVTGGKHRRQFTIYPSHGPKEEIVRGDAQSVSEVQNVENAGRPVPVLDLLDSAPVQSKLPRELRPVWLDQLTRPA